MGTPSNTRPNFKALAKVFKEKHHGIDIFPTLPSQLQKGHEQWKQTNMIKVGMRKMKEAYEGLLHRLTLGRLSGKHIPFRRDEIHAFMDPDVNRNQTPNEMGNATVCPTPCCPNASYMILVVAVSSRLCAWDPLCKYPAVVYNGFKHADCVRAGVEFDIPRDEVDLAQFEHERSKSRLAKKRQREAVRRMKKRAARNLPAV